VLTTTQHHALSGLHENTGHPFWGEFPDGRREGSLGYHCRTNPGPRSTLVYLTRPMPCDQNMRTPAEMSETMNKGVQTNSLSASMLKQICVRAKQAHVLNEATRMHGRISTLVHTISTFCPLIPHILELVFLLRTFSAGAILPQSPHHISTLVVALSLFRSFRSIG